MSKINLLPKTIKEELRSKSLLKVISGLNNFELQSVKTISEAASLGGADLVDIACKPQLVCLLYTSPSPRDVEESRMPSSA